MKNELHPSAMMMDGKIRDVTIFLRDSLKLLSKSSVLALILTCLAAFALHSCRLGAWAKTPVKPIRLDDVTIVRV